MVDIKVEIEEHFQLIHVSGEIDASTSIELDNALKKSTESSENILIDLSKLDYISSAGLGVFISYIEELKTKGITLIIFGLQEKVLEVFQILGLQHIMNISHNREEAIAQINE